MAGGGRAFRAADQPHGSFLELHSCELYPGGCIDSSEATMGGRYMVRVWNFTGGRFDGAGLSGLQLCVLQAAPEDLAAPKAASGEAVVYLPEAATPEQREALLTHPKKNSLSAPLSAIHDAVTSRLRGQWVLITGASSGFGAAAARAFGAEGSKLLLGARRVERLEKVAAEVREAGAAEAHFHALDVVQTSSVEAFMAWASETLADGRPPMANLHVLINNAGGALGLDTVAEGKDEDWETMLQTNVLGVLRMTRAALPLMPHNAGASIINVGSVASRYPYEGGAAYCAAKAGELMVTRTLRLELCGTGIRVSTVDPGLAETEFSMVRFKGDAERSRKVYEGVIPLTAEDVAETLVWVASRPAHVNIDELMIKCTDQAAMHKIHRRKTAQPPTK